MGWKSSTIIVNSDKAINELELLNDLGFSNLKEIAKEPFETVMNPADGKVYIGSFNGNTLICTQELPMTFLEETISAGEKVLAKYFPDTEICALILHSVVNFWGYSISKNNKKIRVRAGSSEDGTMVEFGEPLAQEIELFSKSSVDENGRRTYLFDDYPDEPFEEDQVGENFVFEISGRYLGQNLDMADDLLFEAELKGYEFNSKSSNQKTQPTSKDKPNKWLKYLLIIVAVIIWRILRKNVFND